MFHSSLWVSSLGSQIVFAECHVRNAGKGKRSVTSCWKQWRRALVAIFFEAVAGAADEAWSQSRLASPCLSTFEATAAASQRGRNCSEQPTDVSTILIEYRTRSV